VAPLAFDESEHSGQSGGAGLTALTGKQIGRYLIGQQLGSGGVATVYRAYDQVQGQTVALKLLLPGADEKAYSRFRREAMTAGALRHPHIVRILQIGIAPKGEVAYIAMELVEGDSLADLLRQRGRLRPEESANLLEPIARALAFAHAQGVVHRDVKPGNILMRPASPGTPNSVQLEELEYPVVPLLTDFGIARALDAPELTHMGRTVGTPAYMAPEQCAGSREVDGRADIYALGAVLYRCITGRMPFSGTTTQILHAHVYEPLTIDDAIFRQLSPLMVEVLQRSLAKRPEDRYQAAAEMADTLALVAGRTPLRAESGSEVTATLTMTALPVAFVPAESASTTVLVPALGGRPRQREANPLVRPGVAPAGSQMPPATPPTRTAWSPVPDAVRAARAASGFTWAGFALLLMAGLIVMFLGVLIGMQASRLFNGARSTVAAVERVLSPVQRSSILPSTEVAPVTPVPTPPIVPLPDASTATSLLAATAESPTATPTDTAVPTVAETPAETLPPSSTQTPTVAETPAETLPPSSTQTPTVAETPAETLPPSSTADPTLVACLDAIDEVFRPTILALSLEEQTALGCPVGPAQSGLARVLRFEAGYMVGIDEIAEFYVVYGYGVDAWERRSAPAQGELPPDVPEPAQDRYLPDGRFGALWAADRAWETLGFAADAQAEAFIGGIQEFPGAVLIANRSDGTVATLPVEKQR